MSFLTSLILVWLGLLPPVQEGAATTRRVRVAGPVTGAHAQALSRDGWDVAGLATGRRLDLIVSPEADLDLLGEMFGEDLFTVETRERGRPLVEVLAARGEPVVTAAMMEAAFAGGDDRGSGGVPEGGVPAGYPDLAAVEAALDGFAAAHPTLCRVVDVTAETGAPLTHEGRAIRAVVVSDNVDVEEDEPRFLFVSAHHSREIGTPVFALHVLEQLLAGYGSDPAVTAAVDGWEIWIAPVWNPDGYVEVFTGDNFWRKNRTPWFGDIGVDLNRNYPTGWEGSCGGSGDPSSLTYKGPAPSSEAETQAMLVLGADRRFARVLDVHSSGQEIRTGYGCWDHPLEGWWDDEAEAFATTAGYLGDTGSSCCLGGDIHWHTANSGSLAFLAESLTQFQPAYQDALDEAADFWQATLELLGEPLPLSGHVTDACTNLPLVAEISVDEIVAPNGEVNPSEPAFGRYHLFVPSGVWTVRYEAPGYLPETRVVAITEGVGSLREVGLTPQVTRGCWSHLGQALGAPELLGAGTLEANEATTLTLSGLTPGDVPYLVLGLSTIDAPFKGGVFVPSPDIVAVGVVADAEGEVVYGFPWPALAPPGATLYAQAWVPSGAGPQGWLASNAVSATSP